MDLAFVKNAVSASTRKLGVSVLSAGSRKEFTEGEHQSQAHQAVRWGLVFSDKATSPYSKEQSHVAAFLEVCLGFFFFLLFFLFRAAPVAYGNS